MEPLYEKGFTILRFLDSSPLQKLADIVKKNLTTDPEMLHELNWDQDHRIHWIKEKMDEIETSGLVKILVQSLIPQLIPYLGPDIDLQTQPYLRMSRPESDSDLIGWHRDTFYGNAFEEMNIWFPIIPLREGAGLRILPGSHRMPPTHTRDIEDQDLFRSKVTKGSEANLVGYQYQPKTDDVITNMKIQDTTLLSPKLGECLFFFGASVHRAQNTSTASRFSIDVRVKSAHIITQTKPGYYAPLTRGLVSTAKMEYSPFL